MYLGIYGAFQMGHIRVYILQDNMFNGGVLKRGVFESVYLIVRI